jgi:hypothetical protein
MSVFDADPLLRRLERTAVSFCLVAAAVALGVRGGCGDVAVGILGGGFLIGVSYWAIRSGGDALLLLAGAAREDSRSAAERRRSAVRLGARLVGRYALLAVLAYVMIARLRLHPIGLLVGASSVVAAATIEAVRLFVGAGRPGIR